MKLYIMPNLTREKAPEVTEKLCAALSGYGISFVLPLQDKEKLGHIPKADFVPHEKAISVCDGIIAVGGDGSVIRAAKAAARAGLFVTGVNAGNLAYLCELDVDELSLLEKLKNNTCEIKERSMLHVELIENGVTVSEHECLNDIVFGRGNELKLILLGVKVNGKKMKDFLADGVIFTTPTGSTAYSLSAGGPVIDPGTDVISITPVCPHSLSGRPFIFGSSTEFEVESVKKSDRIIFSCDGEPAEPLSENSKVKISLSPVKARFASFKSDNFIDILNKKLV